VAFDAVAFDIDGTLYPNWRFYLRALPVLAPRLPLLARFGRARQALRREDLARGGFNHEPHEQDKPSEGSLGDSFYARQAALAAGGGDAEAMRRKLERCVYRAWLPAFQGLRCFPHVHETLLRLKTAGLKLGVLSDFPVDEKLRALGLGGLFDAALCSERLGHLKPAPEGFIALAAALDTPPERILYVGNSVRYDIEGARRAGLAAALIRPAWRRGPVPSAAFVFSDYRKLVGFVLG